MRSTLSPGVSRTPGASTRSEGPLSRPGGRYSRLQLDVAYDAAAVPRVCSVEPTIVVPSGALAPAPRTHPVTFASAPTLAPGPTIEARTTAPGPTAAPGWSTLCHTGGTT